MTAKLNHQHRQLAKKRGRFAEFKMRWFLWFKGYRLIAERWRCAAGKIDLVLQRRNRLIFAEIKYRQHGMTDEILSRRQQQRITKAASLFLAKNPTSTTFDCQFDFIIMQVRKNYGVGKITDIHNAWGFAANDLDR
ncbi:YraN family protein [Candidatus Puniceispirillum sp.]|nr:YraN family protein [Candidatus Puniceispirillum sp.]